MSIQTTSVQLGEGDKFRVRSIKRESGDTFLVLEVVSGEWRVPTIIHVERGHLEQLALEVRSQLESEVMA